MKVRGQGRSLAQELGQHTPPWWMPSFHSLLVVSTSYLGTIQSAGDGSGNQGPGIGLGPWTFAQSCCLLPSLLLPTVEMESTEDSSPSCSFILCFKKIKHNNKTCVFKQMLFLNIQHVAYFISWYNIDYRIDWSGQCKKKCDRPILLMIREVNRNSKSNTSYKTQS